MSFSTRERSVISNHDVDPGKHPDETGKFGCVQGFHWLFEPLLLAPPAFTWPLRVGVARLARTGHTGERLRRLFPIRTMKRLRRARLTRTASSTGGVVVLAYHAITDLRDDKVLKRYGVSPDRFADQIEALASRGWTFVSLDDVLDALAGVRNPPPRAILVTFDDAYADLLDEARSILAQRGIPAVVFPVTDLTGKTNEWDREIGAQALDLLDADGLRQAMAEGIEVGSHGASHRSVVELDSEELEAEVRGSAARLEGLGLPRPRAFSYPYGERSPEAAAAIRAAGYAVAFTASSGAVRLGMDCYNLPRIIVLAGDTPTRLRLKVASASWPIPWRKALAIWLRT